MLRTELGVGVRNFRKVFIYIHFKWIENKLEAIDYPYAQLIMAHLT